MDHDEEVLLVARAKQGDIEAFEALYEMHKTAIYRTALAVTRNTSAAEEILQEAFLRAYRSLDDIHDDAPLAPWLYRVTVNLSYDWARRRQRWISTIEQLIERLMMVAVTTPEQLTEERELHEIIHTAIGRLSFNHRITLILYYMHDFSVEEIAEITECPVGTVKSRLYYGRQKLREELLTEERLPQRLIYEYTT